MPRVLDPNSANSNVFFDPLPMNSERYFGAKVFLEDQVKVLLEPSQFTQSQRNEISRLLEDSETSDPALERVLSSVNRAKKHYLQRIFTHQATRHVVLQLLDSETSAYARALNQTSSVLDLIQSDDDGDEEDEDNDADVEEQLRERLRVQFALMPESKLLALSQDLLESGNGKDTTGGLARELQQARERYEIAKQQNRLYLRIQKSVSETITSDPQEAVQPHLLHPRPDMLNLIGRIKSLSARVSVKASYNPEDTKELLNGQDLGESIEPDPKRQKLIVNNDASELLNLVFSGQS